MAKKNERHSGVRYAFIRDRIEHNIDAFIIDEPPRRHSIVGRHFKPELPLIINKYRYDPDFSEFPHKNG
jgi:hypothetical protein